MTEDEIKGEIALAFEYAYRHDDWVEPLESLLAGVSAADALRRPREKGVWDIALHLALWNENIVERVRTGRKIHPDEGWPAPSTVPEDAAWEAAKARLRDSYAAVQCLIETSSLDELRGGYGLADLLCHLTHSGYHLGQIVKLRETMPS